MLGRSVITQCCFYFSQHQNDIRKTHIRSIDTSLTALNNPRISLTILVPFIQSNTTIISYRAHSKRNNLLRAITSRTGHRTCNVTAHIIRIKITIIINCMETALTIVLTRISSRTATRRRTSECIRTFTLLTTSFRNFIYIFICNRFIHHLLEYILIRITKCLLITASRVINLQSCSTRIIYSRSKISFCNLIKLLPICTATIKTLSS